jgi:hypothetical protein
MVDYMKADGDGNVVLATIRGSSAGLIQQARRQPRAAARPRWLLPGHGDTQPLLGVDEVVVVVSTDVICTQLILPVNRLSLAV